MQELKLRTEDKLRRAPTSQALIKESDEFSGLQLIEGTYIPAIQSAVIDLQSHAEAMKNSLDGAIPILRNVLTMYGLLNFGDIIDLNVPEKKNARGQNKAFKVDTLVSFVNLSSIFENIQKFTRYENIGFERSYTPNNCVCCRCYHFYRAIRRRLSKYIFVCSLQFFLRHGSQLVI